MTSATKLGDEPSMYLQRPSTGKSQDVRHILVSTFRELFTRDAIGPDTVKNLSVSKGGDDEYHETYVQSLQKVCIVDQTCKLSTCIFWEIYLYFYLSTNRN